MLRPELQTLVAAGALCRVRGRVDTYTREPAPHNTIRVCLVQCQVAPVHHLQEDAEQLPGAIYTDHLWVRVPAAVIDGRPADPTLGKVARELAVVPPTRLLDCISLVGRLGYYTDRHGQLGMGVQEVLPVYSTCSLVGMLAEAAHQWARYQDTPAHDEALALLDLVDRVMAPLPPGQVAVEHHGRRAVTVLSHGVTAALVRSRAQVLRGRIHRSWEALQRCHRGAAAAQHRAAAAHMVPLLGQLLPPGPVVQPTALQGLAATAALGDAMEQRTAVHRAVDGARAPGRGRPAGFA